MRGRIGRIALARQLKEIGALGGGQLHRLREAAESERGDGNVTALLDPGVPGGAHAADLSDLLAPEPGRAPPTGAARGQADVGGAQLLAAPAQEGADQAPLVLGQAHDGRFYTGIKKQLVTG